MEPEEVFGGGTTNLVHFRDGKTRRRRVCSVARVRTFHHLTMHDHSPVFLQPTKVGKQRKLSELVESG